LWQVTYNMYTIRQARKVLKNVLRKAFIIGVKR
jgi:hypothetical protein